MIIIGAPGRGLRDAPPEAWNLVQVCENPCYQHHFPDLFVHVGICVVKL